jgi:hypothetical protein
MLQKSNEERAGGFVEDREVGAYDGSCRQLNIDLAALKWATNAWDLAIAVSVFDVEEMGQYSSTNTISSESLEVLVKLYGRERRRDMVSLAVCCF